VTPRADDPVVSSSDFALESLARVAAAINTHGYVVQSVGNECSVPGCRCTPTSRPWAYTIGLHGTGRPELLVCGLSDRPALAVINHVIASHLDGEVPLGRDEPLEFKGVPIRLLAVPTRSVAPDRALLAGWYAYHSSFGPCPAPEVVQIVWADAAGRFPWQTAFDPRYRSTQPVLELQPNAMQTELSMPWPSSRPGRRRHR
jgi:hypothetical protein